MAQPNESTPLSLEVPSEVDTLSRQGLLERDKATVCAILGSAALVFTIESLVAGKGTVAGSFEGGVSALSFYFASMFRDRSVRIYNQVDTLNIGNDQIFKVHEMRTLVKPSDRN